MKFCKKCQCDTELYISGRCKACVVARQAAYRAANPDKSAASNAAYMAANREKIASRRAARYAANPDKVKLASAAYRAAHPEKAAAYRAANVDKIASYRKAHPEKYAAFAAAWRAANPEKSAAACATWRAANPSKAAASIAAWCKANPDKMAANTASRRASKLQRTPKWLSREQLSSIEEMYLNAKLMSAFDGQIYHVDHIVPLQGKTVSGLHVPWNLQLLTASENAAKRNRTWPDMP